MLKISRVTLANFCQHEQLDIPLSDGLTVVLGPNGAGKSNFLNAIYGTFTGRFDRGPGSIGECIRKGQNENCYVQATGSIGGREFQLRRDLRVLSDGKAKVDHSLRLDGDRKKAFKTDREIEAWLTDVSGLTPEIMSEFLFLAQEDLFGFLKRSDAERSKKFSALCGTKSYDQVRDRFSHFVKEDRFRYETTKSTLGFARNTYETAKSNRDILETELTKLRSETGFANVASQLADLETQLHTLNETMFALREKEAILERYELEKRSVVMRLTKTERSRTDLQRTMEHLENEQRGYQAEISRLETEVSELLAGKTFAETTSYLTASIQANEKRTLLLRKIEDARDRLKRIPDTQPPDGNENLQREKDYGTVTGRIGELEANLLPVRTMISVLKQLSHDTTCGCPLCGADPGDWKIDLRTLEDSEKEQSRRLEEARCDCENMKRKLNEFQRQKDLYENHRHQRSELSSWLGRFEEELDQCPVHDPDAEKTLTALTERDSQLRESRHKNQTVSDRLDRETELYRECQTEETALHREIQRLEREIAALDATTPRQRTESMERLRRDITRTENRLVEIRDHEKRVTTLEGGLREAVRRQESAHEEILRISETQNEFRNAPAWFGKCDKAVDWLKKDGLPRLVHRSVMKELVAAINEELAQFQDPFRVTVNDDVTFSARFRNGKLIPSKALSGGEKYMLGISFLAAVNRTFARNLGIMFLDEPTASLDALHLQLLFRSLAQWKKVLRYRNQQLIIVTHVEEMAAIADTVIHLGE